MMARGGPEERWARLPAETREKIVADLQKLSAVGPRPAGIPRRPGSETCPLSFSQERLWFLSQLEPGTLSYNRPWAVRLRGSLDVAALEMALNEVVRRHEILRTTYQEVEGSPVQVVHARAAIRLPRTDLSGSPEPEREARVSQAVAEDASRVFDLSRDLMIRPSLFALGSEDSVLSLTTHHIAFDGWSEGVLLRELAALYAAFSVGKVPSLPELPIQYGDYAWWQRHSLRDDAVGSHLAYWEGALRHSSFELRLPAPISCLSAGAPPAASRMQRVTPHPLVQRLKALGRQEGATLYAVLLSAFLVLLARYTDQEDITVGTPVHGRNGPGLEGLIGLFVNPLVLRADLSGNPSFRSVLRQMRGRTLEALAHQDLPFEKLVESLHPSRNLDSTPVFQVLFQLRNFPVATTTWPGLQAAPFDPGVGFTPYDLSVDVVETDARDIACTLLYRPERIEPTAAGALLGHFEVLLESILDEPDTPIGDMPLLTETEARRVLVEWNRTQRPYPPGERIQELFERQVERTPESTAVIFEGRQVSYRTLNRLANRVAHQLLRQGVSSEQIVGVCIERSLDMLVGVLGILKAGGCYLPLDPDHPMERLEFVVRDAGARFLLVHRATRSKIPASLRELAWLDVEADVDSGDGIGNPVLESQGELAYVTYTSGSTGQPKGVLGLHRGAVNCLRWMWESFPFTSDDICCVKTPLTFVDSVWEIFGPLLAGVPSVIVPDAIAKDVPPFLQLLLEQGVTRIFVVPALLKELLDGVERLQVRLPRLQTWASGGETLSRELCLRFHRTLPGARLLNLYGSSEDSAEVTCFDTTAMNPELAAVPIGRPIANTQVYVVDRHLRPVPVGVCGELLVGGESLASGYLNRPELTAERFISAELGSGATSRVFKTGDRARYLPDGNLAFEGRIDDQVKIRGIRVEPGEIEARLRQYPGVSQAAVVARKHGPSGHEDTRLAAFVVPEAGMRAELGVAGLRSYLRAKLPDYMLPAEFAFVDTLPLTSSGKVDRQSLPFPDAVPQGRAATCVAPRDELEKRLAAVWERTLAVSPIGIRDDFFDLGGHSLLAVRLFAEIEKAIGVRLPVRVLFEAPTIEGLAGLIREKREVRAGSALVPLQTQGSRPPIFWVHAAGGHVLSFQRLARYLGPEQPSYALSGDETGEAGTASLTVEELAVRYLREVEQVQPSGPYFLGGL
ncbi:MAG: amino acid adenylation domain-containing protein, partial [Dehalococcoidia bacterium]|nr:amino acid adenylation domain-containing protein [Dehalococcoidia bacterium]